MWLFLGILNPVDFASRESSVLEADIFMMSYTGRHAKHTPCKKTYVFLSGDKQNERRAKGPLMKAPMGQQF